MRCVLQDFELASARFVVVFVQRVWGQGSGCTVRRVAQRQRAAAGAPAVAQPTAVYTCACTWHAWLLPSFYNASRSYGAPWC